MTIRAIIALAALAPAASAGIFFDESVDGDLSNDRFNPTNFVLSNGLNSFTMDVIDSDQPTGDLDYFSVTIGAGQSIESIILASSTNPAGGFDAVAFVALQLGSQVTVDPAAPDPSPLDGFIIGSPDLIGTNILPDLSATFPAGLPAGDYSFWVQQTGDDLTRLTLEFNVVPAPTTTTAALAGLALVASRRRR